MGAEQSKNFSNASPFDTLPDMVGCDTKGTVLCKESKLTCLNGGVCALFLKEVEDACEERCKCPRDYIGDYCQFYAGFYTATIGLVIGLFLTILFLIFIAICIWYCCNRKKRKNELLESGKRAPERAYLTNRITNQKDIGHLDFQAQTLNPSRTEQASLIDSGFCNPQVQSDSTSRSYSIYDNVVWNEEDTNWLNAEQDTTLPMRESGGRDGNAEVSHFMDNDSVHDQQHMRSGIRNSPIESAR